MCLFLALLFLNNMFIFKPTNRKSAFIESASFKSLFLVKFQVSTLDENQHLLVKLSCQSACENLDAIIPRSALCFFQPILQLSKKSLWPSHVIALCLFTVHALMM